MIFSRFDRHGASVYHPEADQVGNALFYGAMPPPILLMFDNKVRKDAFKIAFLHLESMAVTGFFIQGSWYIWLIVIVPMLIIQKHQCPKEQGEERKILFLPGMWRLLELLHFS